jgi:Tfp pilus assembly protein PilV
MIKLNLLRKSYFKMATEQSGSLLIEALLSTVILSVSLTLIIQSMVMSLRSKNHVRDYIQAVILAESTMAQTLFKADQLDLSGSEGKFDEPFEKYKYKMTYDDKAMDSENLKELNLNITWQSGRRKNALPLISYIYAPSDENE